MKKIPFNIPDIDLFQLTDKKYFYKIKKDFLINDFQFQMIESEPEIDLKNDEIILFKNDEKKDIVEEVNLNFFSDYMPKLIEKATENYIKDFHDKLKSKIGYKDDVILDYFKEHEMELKRLLDKVPKILLLNGENIDKILISNVNSILDSINSTKLDFFNLPKIHLDLSKVQVLLLFHSLLEKNVIVNLQPNELFRMVENYFTYRDDKENILIKNAYKTLHDYTTNTNSKKTVATSTVQKLEDHLEELSNFLHNNFGEN